MNLDHLHYFVTTADTLHTAKAGKIARVGQSTICHGIRKLEDELGLALFEKHGKRIALTSAGKRFAVRARQLLGDAQKIKAEFRSQNLPLEGTIRIGASHGISNHIVAPAIGRVQAAHPSLLFETYSLRSAQVVEGIVAKILDVGICFSPTAHPEIQEIARKRTRLVVAVRPNHSLLKIRKKLSYAVSCFPCASPRAFAGIEVCENHPALKKLKIKSDPNFIFDSYEVAAGFLKNSDAWCLLPEILLKPLALNALRIDGLEASADVVAITPKGRPLPEQIKTELTANI